MSVQVHPNVVMKPAAVAEWETCGTAIAIGKKIWPAEDWRQLYALWAVGAGARGVEALFASKGYSPDDIETMRALLAGNPFLLPPIERALFVLAGAAARDGSTPGGFRIAQTAARSIDVIAAANRILCTLALPQIDYPNARKA